MTTMAGEPSLPAGMIVAVMAAVIDDDPEYGWVVVVVV